MAFCHCRTRVTVVIVRGKSHECVCIYYNNATISNPEYNAKLSILIKKKTETAIGWWGTKCVLHCVKIVPAQHFIHIFCVCYSQQTPSIDYPRSDQSQRHTHPYTCIYLTCVTRFGIAFVFVWWFFFVCFKKCVFCWVFDILIATEIYAFRRAFSSISTEHRSIYSISRTISNFFYCHRPISSRLHQMRVYNSAHILSVLVCNSSLCQWLFSHSIFCTILSSCWFQPIDNKLYFFQFSFPNDGGKNV